jgi:hypothetical protein
MCNLSEGIREEGRALGRLEGMINIYSEFGISFPETVNRIFSKFNMSISDAENIVKKHWK